MTPGSCAPYAANEGAQGVITSMPMLKVLRVRNKAPTQAAGGGNN